jgi:hypothetical protein
MAKKFFVRTLDLILAVLILAGVVYALSLRPEANVIASDEDFHSNQVYLEAVNKQLHRLKNRNKITFNESALAAQLQKQFPEVKSVNVELPIFSQSPTIRLTVSPPAIYLTSLNQTYVVDEAGVAIARKAELPRVKALTQVDDQTGYQLAAGQQVLNNEGADFINALVSQSRKSSIPIDSLILPARVQELDLKTKDRPYYVKFNLSGDIERQIGQFLAARKQFDKNDSQPKQYLDVRVIGKVYYK